MSWMIRVQNDRNFQDMNSDSSMFDVSTLFHPSLGLKVSNGEIDKIRQYLDGEVNLFSIYCLNGLYNSIYFLETCFGTMYG